MNRTHSPSRRDPVAALINAEQSDSDDGRYYGLYEARVTDNKDPDKQGRVKARIYWQIENRKPFETGWIARATHFRGPTNMQRNRVFGDDWPLPEVGSVIYVQFVEGNLHNAVMMGMPSYLEGPYGAPDVPKDTERDWSLRIDMQNGFSLGVDTEGNLEIVATSIRIKSLTHLVITARGVMTLFSTKLRLWSLTVLRLLGVTIDKTNYPRPDEKAEIRELMIDAMKAEPGRKDPGIGKVPDLEE